MADGPAGFTQDFSCPALLRSLLRFVWLRVLVYHHLWSDFPNASTHHPSCDIAVLQPQRCRNIVGLGSSPFARHYLGNHFLFSLPTGTKMFQFPAFAAHTYVRADSHSDCRVVPFGDPRIKGYLHLIADYRSLSRPSSPVRAKASTVRPKNSLFAFIMIHHTFI